MQTSQLNCGEHLGVTYSHSLHCKQDGIVALDIGLLIIALMVILLSAEFFTNGIEWLGQKLQLSEGAVGSVLAAVGTALPETLIPFVAIIFFHGAHSHEVGVGAIAGAPFMLSTLTLGICGIAIAVFARSGRRLATISLNKVVITRDIKFFALAYSLGMAAVFVSDWPILRIAMALMICAIYPIYIQKTFAHQGEVGTPPEHLHLERLVSRSDDIPRLRMILLQVTMGIGGILAGAFLFVDHVQSLALSLDVSPLILSLIIAPVATELPEKVNSILWVRNSKDTLAMGNITGALVFQSCIPVAFGVGFTKWDLSPAMMATGVVAIVSAGIYGLLIAREKLQAWHLALGTLVYAVTITLVVMAESGQLSF